MSVTNFEIFEVFVYALILVWLNMVLLILLLHSDWDSLKISLIEQIFMSVVITVQLPDFTAQWLEELTQDSGLSKTDLIVQGLESIFASRLDQKFMYLGDKQLDEVLDFSDTQSSITTKHRLTKTMQTYYPWSKPDSGRL